MRLSQAAGDVYFVLRAVSAWRTPSNEAIRDTTSRFGRKKR